MNVMLKPPGQELVLTRDLKAPREKVFVAWTDMKQSSVWWVPKDCTLISCEMDVRPGGKWRRSMRGPNGNVITKYGVYREVSPPVGSTGGRLVFTYNSDYANGTVDPETLVTVTLEELAGGRTRLTLTHSGFWDEASKVSHIGGWTGVMERITDFISA
jgi:glutathione S-transferase